MCSNHRLDDDISDLFGDLASAAPEPRKVEEIRDTSHLKAATPEEFAKAALSNATHDPDAPALYVEPCPKCKGSGRFVSYAGRVVGNCFHCKGTGEVKFKTSPEARAKAADAREAKKQADAKAHLEKVAQWFKDHEAEGKWLGEACARGFEFAKSLATAIGQYGYLTEKQLAAVHRCMAKDEERDRERAEIAERAPDINAEALSKIHTAFENALERSIKYPKMRLDRFLFSLVRSGSNAGAIYVKSISKDDAGERTYFGKIVEGRFFRAWKTTEEDEAAIIAAASDPEAAAIAYGRRVGACSICGRRLTNHESIDRGIGPICAENFGW